MTKTKTLLVITLIITIIACSIPSTIMYFINRNREINSFKIGENKIKITETFDPPTDLHQGENTYKKEVSVTNTGNTNTYVRVFFDFSSNDISSVSEVSTDNGETFYSYDSFKNNLPENWEYITDGALAGYFYYNTPIEPGESTTKLLTNIKTTFASAMDIDEYDVIIYAESVQTKNKDGESFTGNDAWKKAWTEFIQRK